MARLFVVTMKKDFQLKAKKHLLMETLTPESGKTTNFMEKVFLFQMSTDSTRASSFKG